MGIRDVAPWNSIILGIYTESILGSAGESNIEKKRKKKRARDRFGEKRKEAQEN